MPVTQKQNHKDSLRRKLTEPRVSSGISSAVAVPPDLLRDRWWARRWVACIFLVVVCAAVYSPVRHYPFIDYDDEGYVSSNTHVLAGISWETVAWSFTTTEQANWHPLTWLSHALDCELFGLNPGAHHLTSVGFHAANVVLLFLLLQAVTGYRGRSLIVAALFALHPFNVDSVAWIAERKNLLSTFFFLLSLGAYGWYARKSNWWRYGLVCGLFVLGLMAKPMLVTFPFILLLVDYWPLQRVAGWVPVSEHFPTPQQPVSRLLLEKLPLLAISAASSLATMVAQKGAIQPLQVLPLDARLENAVASYFLYLWKALWPSGFAIHYPNPFDPPPNDAIGAAAWAAFLAGIILLLVVTWIAWKQKRDRPFLVVGWLWYLGSLVPVIGIVQVGIQGMADRYVYIPLIGIFTIVTWWMADRADRLRMPLVWRAIVVSLVLATLSFLTVRQVGYWRSSYALWSHALDVTRNNVRANNHVGSQLTQHDRPEEALPYFREAARLDPTDTDSRLVLGAYSQDNGHLQEAIKDYEVVVHSATDAQQVVLAYVNLSIIFAEMGDFPRSHEAYSRAALKDPEVTNAKMSELDGMVASYPTDEGYLRLGVLAEQSGLTKDARVAYQRALQLNPGRIEAQRALNHLNSSLTQTQ